MRRFVCLFDAIDQTNKAHEKVAALVSYFLGASGGDKLWAISLLTKQSPKKIVTVTLLMQWATAKAMLPPWLLEELLERVGNTSETTALILNKPKARTKLSLSEWLEVIRGLRDLDEECKRKAVLEAWDGLTSGERFVFNKIISGSFRLSVSSKEMTDALVKCTGLERYILASRLVSDWHPDNTDYKTLFLEEKSEDHLSKPFSFHPSKAIDPNKKLGDPIAWLAEFKWDGIRAQIIKRSDHVFIWSRDQDLISARFPELQSFADNLPDGTVLDGEIIAFKEGSPQGFQSLQTRLNRRTISKNTLKKAPIIFKAFDIMEFNGLDLRQMTLSERRSRLIQLMIENGGCDVVQLSHEIKFDNWINLDEFRKRARTLGCEGIVLKRFDTTYIEGKNQFWFSWLNDPLTINAVLIYVERGAGQNASTITGFTFAVWDKGRLVPICKTNVDLNEADYEAVKKYAKENLIERFGPVLSIEPNLVFEIAFDGLQPNKRRKSGMGLKNPTIKSWKKKDNAEDAEELSDLQRMLD